MKIICFKSAIKFVVFSFTVLLFACNGKSDKPTEQMESTNKEKSFIDKINESGQINVGFEPDAPPLYFEKSGKKSGFDYDLINYLSKEVFDGVTINTIEAGYDDLPKELNLGNIDIMAGGRTEEEKEDELYTDSYLSFGYCLITNKKSSKKYTSLSSLIKAKVGVYDDYTAEWLKNKVPNADIVIIGDREDENTPTSDWMSGLTKNEFDAVVYDYPFAANEVLDYDNNLVISNTNLNGDELSEYVLVVKNVPGAEELVQKINIAISKYKETPKYSDAIVEYIPVSNMQQEGTKDLADAYIINRGETLAIIAKKHLGDATKWKDIYELNKSILASPDIIYPGQKLIKPQGWTN